MSNQITSQFLGPLLKQHYAVTILGEPELLHEAEEKQSIFKVELAGGEVVTVRLCLTSRSQAKVLSEARVLLFIKEADFPASRLRMTIEGELIFEWQPNCWGYVQEYIEGKHPHVPEKVGEYGPMLDLHTLAEVGHLLGRLHKLVIPPADYPLEASWLEEVPLSIERAKQAATRPEWQLQAAEVVETLRNLPLEELKSLPSALIHTDAHEGNLIRTPDGRLHLLDWENAALDRAIIDLALVLSWLCEWKPVAGTPVQPPELYEFDEEYCRTFLAHYQQERPLSEAERQLLGPAMRFFTGWFAARDLERELAEPGKSEGMAFMNWAFMRSVTPQWAETLTRWATETASPL